MNHQPTKLSSYSPNYTLNQDETQTPLHHHIHNKRTRRHQRAPTGEHADSHQQKKINCRSREHVHDLKTSQLSKLHS